MTFLEYIKQPWRHNGASAMTLYAVYTGDFSGNKTPYDPDDWCRCLQALRMLFGDDEARKKQHLVRVAERHGCPIWRAFAENYYELMATFAQEWDSNRAPKTYALIKKLRGEAS